MEVTGEQCWEQHLLEERRWVATQSQPRRHQAHVDLCYWCPFDVIPKWGKWSRPSCPCFDNWMWALSWRRDNFGQGSFPGSMAMPRNSAMSSYQGSWEDYGFDLGERAGQHATAFTAVTDTGQYHRLSLSPAWPLFFLSLSLVFSDCNLTEIQCSGHVFLFISFLLLFLYLICL